MLKTALLIAGVFFCVHANANAEREVLVSVWPVGMLVAAIGGERVHVSVLIPEGMVPHDYQLRPSDLPKISHAWLLVWGGKRHEAFLANAVERLSQSHKLDFGNSDDGYHFWMNPEAAMIAAQNISNALSRLDPEGTAYYHANLHQLQQRASELDLSLRLRLAPYSGHGFIGTHDGITPFTRHYGMRQTGILQSESSHSGGVGLATLAALRKQVETGEARCVMQDLEAVSGIADKLRIPPEQIIDVDIMGNHLPLSVDGYLSMLEGVAAHVTQCFVGKAK